MWEARAGARSVHSVRVDVHYRTLSACAPDPEISSAPEYLSSRSPICTNGRHQGTPGNCQHSTNCGRNRVAFPPSRTITLEPAPSAQIADGSVDCLVARFL